jgi:hypothetical protein
MLLQSIRPVSKSNAGDSRIKEAATNMILILLSFLWRIGILYSLDIMTFGTLLTIIAI